VNEADAKSEPYVIRGDRPDALAPVAFLRPKLPPAAATGGLWVVEVGRTT
jgi:hypothetical protein